MFLDQRKRFIIEELSKPGTIKRFFIALRVNSMSEGKILKLYYLLTDKGGAR